MEESTAESYGEQQGSFRRLHTWACLRGHMMMHMLCAL